MGWSCAPPPPLAPPGPGEWGLLLGRNSQETLRGGHGLLYPDTRPHAPQPFYPSSLHSLIW